MSENGGGAGVLSTAERLLLSGASGVCVQHTVEWVDTDAAGHQHNSAIMRWVESAEAELFRQLRLPEYFPTAPRVHQSINFLGKLWFGQRVSTTLWVKKIGTTSMTFSFEVQGHSMPERAGGLAASGTLITAHVPLGSSDSMPWPASFLTTIKSEL